MARALAATGGRVTECINEVHPVTLLEIQRLSYRLRQGHLPLRLDAHRRRHHGDSSYAVAKAYATGNSISFALYSSDGAYHSGKFFTTSDVGDWKVVGRSTLRVTWGSP